MSLVQNLLNRGEAWEDPYAKNGWRKGKRCPAVEPGYSRFRCMNVKGHTGAHRWTSGADGRSVTWP